MTFHNVQFPPTISLGARGGVRFSTSIVTTASGYEYRNINWSLRRGEWDVAHGIKSEEDMAELIKFFHARRGKAYGFRFKDWADYRLPFWRITAGDMDSIPVQFTTNGATQTFQIKKVYSDGAGSYTRNITKPVASTVKVLENGTEIFSPTSWTCDSTTGIITLASSVYTTSGHTIAVVCEFDVPARFDTDDMPVTVNDVENYSWSQIPVVEIRDIA